MKFSDLKDKSVVVWGAGLEGQQAVGAALQAGAAKVVAAIDSQAAAGAAQSITEKEIPILYGQAGQQALRTADVIIKSPGVPLNSPLLKELQAAKKTITSSTQLWMADTAARTIAVTGSKGKSTTSSLLAHLMQGLGFDVQLGGNIGVPLLSLGKNHDWYVAELSSHQTMTLELSPRVAVFTAFFPEHLDYYGTLDAYYDAKLVLAKHNPGAIIAGSESAELVQHLKKVVPASSVTWVPSSELQVLEHGIELNGRQFISNTQSPLRGRHNLVNLAICLAVLQELGVDLRQRQANILQALATFKPLKHRLQIVGERRGKLWVNDSISTTPESAIAALEAFANQPTTIILGGNDDRKLSYNALRDYLRQRNSPVLLLTIPDSGPRIAKVLAGLPHELVECNDLSHAVTVAAKLTPAGGVVLLSPATTSYGKYKNFEDRGDQFIAAVEKL